MKLSDFKGIFLKSKAEVISVENVSADYWVVRLKPVAGIEWRPGEHGIFSFLDKSVNGKKWRAFSIAAIPEDGELVIGTRTGREASSFKKKLTEMKPGELIKVRGPFGWFTLQDNSTPIIMAASGVGITPVTAIFKELRKGNNRKVNLVYASSDHYLFKDELEKTAEGDENINIQFTITSDETKNELTKLAKDYGNDALYYISGSLPMMKSTRKVLKEAGIKSSRFIHDPFLGY